MANTITPITASLAQFGAISSTKGKGIPQATLKPLTKDIKAVTSDLSPYKKLDKKLGGFLPGGITPFEAKSTIPTITEARTQFEKKKYEDLKPFHAQKLAEEDAKILEKFGDREGAKVVEQIQEKRKEIMSGRPYGGDTGRKDPDSAIAQTDPIYAYNLAKKEVAPSLLDKASGAVKDWKDIQIEKFDQLSEKYGNTGATISTIKGLQEEGVKGLATGAFELGTGLIEGSAKAHAKVSDLAGWTTGSKFFKKIDDKIDTLQDAVLNSKLLSQNKEVPFGGASRFAGEYMIPYGTAENITVKALAKASPKLALKYPKLTAIFGSFVSNSPITGSFSMAQNVDTEEAQEQIFLDAVFAPLSVFGAKQTIKEALKLTDAPVRGAILESLEMAGRISNEEVQKRVSELNNLTQNVKEGAEKLKEYAQSVPVKSGGYMDLGEVVNSTGLTKEPKSQTYAQFASENGYPTEMDTMFEAQMLGGRGLEGKRQSVQNIKSQDNAFIALQDNLSKGKNEYIDLVKRGEIIDPSGSYKKEVLLSNEKALKIKEIQSQILVQENYLKMVDSLGGMAKKENGEFKTAYKRGVETAKKRIEELTSQINNLEIKKAPEIITPPVKPEIKEPESLLDAVTNADKIKEKITLDQIQYEKEIFDYVSKKLNDVGEVKSAQSVEAEFKKLLDDGKISDVDDFLKKSELAIEKRGQAIIEREAKRELGEAGSIVGDEAVRKELDAMADQGALKLARSMGFKGKKATEALDFIESNDYTKLKGFYEKLGYDPETQSNRVDPQNAWDYLKERLAKKVYPEGRQIAIPDPEAEAIKKQIADFTKGYKSGKKQTKDEIKAVQKEVLAYARKNLPKDKISKVVTDIVNADSLFDLNRAMAKIDTIKKSLPVPEPKDSRNLKKEIEKLVLKQSEKIKEDPIREMRNKMLLGEESLEEIVLRKRGIVSDKEALERAQGLDMSIDKILAMPKGQTLNKEEITAVRQVLATERKINMDLRQTIDEGVGLDSQTRRYIEQLDLDGVTEGMTDEEIMIKVLQEQTIKLRKLEIINFGIGSEAGRSLQALKQDVPAVDQKLRTLYARIKNRPKAEQQAIIELIGKIDLENPREFLSVLNDLDKPKGLKDRTGRFIDAFAEYATAVKLWSLPTHIVNFFGNTLRQSIDIGIKGVVSPETIFADLAGAKFGLSKGIKNALDAITNEGNARKLSKFVEETGKMPAIKGKKGEIVRLPFRFLSASDEIFYSTAYNRALFREAKRSGRDMKEFLQNPPLKSIEFAVKEAKRNTFQEEMGRFMKQLNNLRDPSNFDTIPAKLSALVGKLFVPFMKTPNNIYKQAIDFSPIGFAKNAGKIAKGDELGRTLLAESILGTALTFYMLGLVEEGKITGSAPKNENERNTWLLNNQENSIKIGNTWHSYSRIDPIGIPISIAVDAYNNFNQESYLALFNAITSNLKDKTFTKGFKDLTDLISGEDWERKRAFNNTVLGATIPTGVGALARAIDPVNRDTKGQGIKAEAEKRIPFLSKNLPAKVDVLGDEITRDQEGFETILNPIFKKEEIKNPEKRAIIEEWDRVGYSTGLPYPSRGFSYKGEQIDFSPQEYESFSKEFGKNFRENMVELIRKPEYQSAPLEDQIEKIESAKKKGAEDAKKWFLETQKGIIEEPKTKVTKTKTKSQEKFFALPKDKQKAMIKKLIEKGLSKEEIRLKLDLK